MKGISFSCSSVEQMGKVEHSIRRFSRRLASSGVVNPSPSNQSSFWALARSPSLLSSLQKTDSFTRSLSLIHSAPLRIWPPGRRVALEQALLIEHLFRHGAGSVACGQAAGGSSRGDIMSYYISWDVSFTCVYAHFTGKRSHGRLEKQAHAAVVPRSNCCCYHHS